MIDGCNRFEKVLLPIGPSGSLACIATVLLLASAACCEETVGYRNEILPLLSDRCFKCHGPDSATREAGMRLDQFDTATSILESGSQAIVPGDAAASALVQRIETTDEHERMPPTESGKTLTDSEKELLRTWIEQGAEYQLHWAFDPPQRQTAPPVAQQKYVNNPIDLFVQARLEIEGLSPSLRASKERLVRRLFLDLIGLPPTIKEINAFLADDSQESIDRVVERLMASPHYGEQMAVDWLDVARFADTNGYQNDYGRNMWPWRDWVIDAYNSHIPYDQFVIEQIAGDLLPNATQQQRIATGFNRNNRTVTECGSIEEEWLVENVVDRVDTTSTALLGLTLACARCHDHKFEPISQREFYEFFAFFNNIDEKGVYFEQRGNVPPLVLVTTPAQEDKLADLASQIVGPEKRFKSQMSNIEVEREAWVDALSNSDRVRKPELTAAIELTANGDILIAATNRVMSADAESKPPQWMPDLFGLAATFDAKHYIAYSDLDFPMADLPFSWSLWVKPQGQGSLLARMDSTNGARGCDLFLYADGKVGAHIVDHWPDNALNVASKSNLTLDRWSHVVMTYDGSKKAAGVSISINGQQQETTITVDQLTGTFATDTPLHVGQRSTDFPVQAAVADVELFQSALSNDEMKKVFAASLARQLADVKLADLNDAMRAEFDEMLLSFSDTPIAKSKQELTLVQQARDDFKSTIPTTMVMQERVEPRNTYVLERGLYDQPDKSEILLPNVPDVFPPLPEGAPQNRLGLARWMVSDGNPLTARVAVNRLWQRFFGVGLVKTAENFGVQGEAPSHPELLDWLATELMRSGWDVQHIQRLIVTSHTYQQQSEASPQLYERDPENRLLARGPRYRMPAEEIRDNALAVSGLLTRKIGGPPVRPYQPAGLWKELAGGAVSTYTQGEGDDLYRRSLYTYRKRTVPHPSMAIFDAPAWEFCRVRRGRTNTPLQALAVMNDVTYLEASRKLAERMMTEGGTSPDAQLNFAFRLATGRVPSSSELSLLRRSLQKYLQRYVQEPVAAEELLAHGESPRLQSLNVAELAAHTAVASILLNLDETISKN